MFNKVTSQEVIDRIQEKILSGEFSEGDKLPSERELASIYKIGRPALREALRVLEAMGLVERRHGQGNFIVDRIHKSMYRPMTLSFMLRKGSIEEILELRCLIESFTVRAAAQRATERDIIELYDIHRAIERARTQKLKAELDQDLHIKMVRLCDNELVISIVEGISQLLLSLSEKSALTWQMGDDSPERVYAEHLAIIKAIEAHDSEQAEQAIRNHLGNINRDLIAKV